jgi:hypothetical protein
MHPVSVSYGHDYKRVRFVALIVNKCIKLLLVISVGVTLRLGKFKAYRHSPGRIIPKWYLKISKTWSTVSDLPWSCSRADHKCRTVCGTWWPCASRSHIPAAFRSPGSGPLRARPCLWRTDPGTGLRNTRPLPLRDIIGRNLTLYVNDCELINELIPSTRLSISCIFST